MANDVIFGEESGVDHILIVPVARSGSLLVPSK
jgi:hypothetical protein